MKNFATGPQSGFRRFEERRLADRESRDVTVILEEEPEDLQIDRTRPNHARLIAALHAAPAECGSGNDTEVGLVEYSNDHHSESGHDSLHLEPNAPAARS